jgi:hypothetical protein
LLLNRFLLQTPSSNSQVQAEVRFALDKAVGFTGTSEADIVAAYTALSSVATNILTTDAQLASAFGIDKDNVGLTTVSKPTVTAPPPVTPAPPTPSPGPAVSTPAPAAAPALSVMLALILGLLLALMQ